MEDHQSAPEQVTYEQILAAVKAWAAEKGQNIFEPGTDKYPYVVKIEERIKREKFKLPGEDDPLQGLSSQMEEMLFPWKFQETLWFDEQNDASLLVCAIADLFHPLLCHNTRLAVEKESSLAKAKRRESPLAMPHQGMVRFVVTWCWESQFDPFDQELPVCYDINAMLPKELCLSEVELLESAKLEALLSQLDRLSKGEVASPEAQIKIAHPLGSREWQGALELLAFQIRQRLDEIKLSCAFSSILYFPKVETYSLFRVAFFEQFPNCLVFSATQIER